MVTISKFKNPSMDSNLRLFKRFRIKKILSIVLISMFLIALVASNAQAADGIIRLWDTVANKGAGKWTTDNIIQYKEGDCIPGYIQWTALAGEDMIIKYDYSQDADKTGTVSYLGITQLEFCGSCPDNIESPPDCYGDYVPMDEDDAPDGTSLELIEGNYDGTGGLTTHAYRWHATEAGTYCFRFCARISTEASLFTGSNMHVSADPGPDIPIPTNQFECIIETEPFTVCYGVTPTDTQILAHVDLYDDCSDTPVITRGAGNTYTVSCNGGDCTGSGSWTVRDACTGIIPDFEVCFGTSPTDPELIAKAVAAGIPCAEGSTPILADRDDIEHTYSVTCTNADECTCTYSGTWTVLDECADIIPDFEVCFGTSPTDPELIAKAVAAGIPCAEGSTPILADRDDIEHTYSVTCTNADECTCTYSGTWTVLDECADIIPDFEVCSGTSPTNQYLIDQAVAAGIPCAEGSSPTLADRDDTAHTYSVTCTNADECTCTYSGSWIEKDCFTYDTVWGYWGSGSICTIPDCSRNWGWYTTFSAEDLKGDGVTASLIPGASSGENYCDESRSPVGDATVTLAGDGKSFTLSIPPLDGDCTIKDWHVWLSTDDPCPLKGFNTWYRGKGYPDGNSIKIKGAAITGNEVYVAVHASTICPIAE